jgi:OPT oligopeptide transporter protein
LQRVESPGNAMADFNTPSSAHNARFNEKAGESVDVKGTFGDQKSGVIFIERVHTDSTSSLSKDPEQPKAKNEAVETDLQLVTRVLSVEDDPSENPWTFRMWFLGMICYSVSCHEFALIINFIIGLGLGVFTATTSTINHFKPQPMAIHFVFIVVIAYVLGKFMEKALPRRGRIGRILNPGPVGAPRSRRYPTSWLF